MPNSAPLISIIVPVYNAEDYLRYCIDSILQQSYTNLEVILVDDGAKDSSPAICDEYAAQDSRITVIHQENGGIAKAQNAGLDAARGEYIAFADFEHPLAAYQTVFCKSLRLIGDRLGRNTEARYFNEANWCRLYKRELWDGIRFPEGMYAQDVMVAGDLYTRMRKVADLNVNLYNWLQSAGSVTHKERSFSFYHDNFAAGAANFRLCLEQGVRPGRSYYTLVGAFHEETTAPDFREPASQQQHEKDKAELNELISKLSPAQRIHCAATRQIRLLEKYVYDAKIKNMK
ncbi:MAG: glycosyltransferase [Bifidobacterium breve]|nr:glycosyltransferase [Bifidobacterium breve]